MGSTPEAACAPAAGPAASPAATAGLVVFARLPVPGRVKTRLAASVGPEAACRFYKACAEHVMLVAYRYAWWMVGGRRGTMGKVRRHACLLWDSVMHMHV